MNATEMYSYVVALAGDVDFDDDVDPNDFYIFAGNYGKTAA